MAKKPKSGKPQVAFGRAAKTAPGVAASGVETPLFCFRYADRRTDGRYAFKHEDGPDAPRLLEFICEMSRLTWAEIERQRTGTNDRHRKHHSMPIGSINPRPQEDLRRAKLDETFGDEIFRFRIGGLHRLWGFRRDRTFHVVWSDTDHDVYSAD